MDELITGEYIFLVIYFLPPPSFQDDLGYHRWSCGKTAMILQHSLSTKPSVGFVSTWCVKMFLPRLCFKGPMIGQQFFLVFFFFFLFYGKSLSSRPAINVIVSECQKFEDGEEKCNCWKVTHLKVKVNHKQQNIFEPNYWWWHNGQASIKLVERFKEKNCLSSITEPIKKVTSTLMLRNWRNSFISRNGFINRSMTFGNS